MDAVTTEDEQILDMVAGDSGWAEVGADVDGVVFAQDFAEVGLRGRKRRKKRRLRRARRKGFSSIRAMRKARRRKIRKGLKKVVNNKIVRAIGKAALSVVPGGQVVTGITTAARLAKKVASAARKGNKTAQAGVALARAARQGDRRALGTLQKAATGRYRSLPVPASYLRQAGFPVGQFAGQVGADDEGNGTYAVTAPSGKRYTFEAREL